ncbi:hypothetical protein AKJ40_03555 [candidate division MSBL1 archaeon SCGC-AAA259M10]|uniref:Uncharacterized protein n=1 Tax=candidate division MSBL1 archaeon SCGC-AAA259M10 TaxID=1698270 RepID=A0A133UYI0_9EURY|nr:hypothetical protein AKJ40_03555 [candidate division MSBL1 archaeon SCGC-AAA259M10]
MKLRKLYFFISISLYSQGSSTRTGCEHPRIHEFKDWLEIELIAFKVLEEHGTSLHYSQLSPKKIEGDSSVKNIQNQNLRS